MAVLLASVYSFAFLACSKLTELSGSDAEASEILVFSAVRCAVRCASILTRPSSRDSVAASVSSGAFLLDGGEEFVGGCGWAEERDLPENVGDFLLAASTSCNFLRCWA